MSQVKPVRGKSPQEKAQEERGAPGVVGNYAALHMLLKGPGPQAYKIVWDRARGDVVLHGFGLASAVLRADVVLLRHLEAVLACKGLCDHVCSLVLKKNENENEFCVTMFDI